jgi:two-component system chemotaxis sensor kinase CheA
MKALLDYLLLPSEITAFERKYLQRLNRVGVAFFALHIPVMILIAWANSTRPGLAAVLTTAVVVGPGLAMKTLDNPRRVSVVLGVAAMFMSGLLIHFGQGPLQIEMHFYIFALLAMCAVFGNPMVIVAAAVTVALHHLVVWLALPRSVFNYDAAWWVVGVHAAFVVLESVAACFIARSFFDNVIGLDKIVQARTAALDEKNRDMRLLLDNMEQGFLTIDEHGAFAQERSAAVDRWFGAPGEAKSWVDYLAKVSPSFAARTALGWAEVVEDFLPIELTLDQMPAQLVLGETHLRVEYRPIGGSESKGRFLVVVSDVTTEVRRERAEMQARESMAMFERIIADRSGFQSFFEEATAIVDALIERTTTEPAVVKRLIHTLKGNTSLYGLPSVAAICHALEDLIEEGNTLPARADYQPLASRWAELVRSVHTLIGQRSVGLEIDDVQYQALESAARSNEPASVLLRRVQEIRLEPMSRKLEHFASQARRLAHRLEKGDLDVVVDDGGVRLDARRWAPFWSAFIHPLRNALGHGIESADERVRAGKPAAPTLTLRTSMVQGSIVIEISDDGRGIDWAAIAEKARSRGLAASTPAELQRALFVGGVSTADVVSDLSGRGVGMGALLEGIVQLEGELTIDSVPGRGTTLRMTFPQSAGRSLSAMSAAA